MKATKKHLIPALIVSSALILAIALFSGNIAKVESLSSRGGQKMLVIDPGHGGIDSGAVSAGGAKESDINLQIALATNEIALFFGVETLMTRTDSGYIADISSYSEHNDLVSRAEKANSNPESVLLSIHQNTYPTGQPSGSEVIYAPDSVSKAWGKLMHSNLIEYLDPQNRRVPIPSNGNVLILEQADCPALLVECGFMSNFTEIEKLLTHEYQTELAVVMLASFLQFDFDQTYT